MECKHERFKVKSNVFRLTDEDNPEIVIKYRLEVEVHCMDCFCPFEFIGVKQGYHHRKPTIDFEGTELRVPIKPI